MTFADLMMVTRDSHLSSFL